MRNREWRFYIQDMIDFYDKAQSYTSGLDFDAFVADELIYDATLLNILLIGEAATQTPQNTSRNPQTTKPITRHLYRRASPQSRGVGRVASVIPA